MIKCYFGVPGVGKSTILVKIARKEQKRLIKKYDNIYSINIDIKGVERIKYDDLRKYRFSNALILIDEITMDADNRNFKSFTEEERDFYILHRHLGVDIIYATQNFENVDKKIRDLTSELWYMEKSAIPFLRQITTSKRIYRKITINEYTSDLKLGYRFCSFTEMLFNKNMEITYRRPLYKYFDSFSLLKLEKRPLYEEVKQNNIIETIERNIIR